MHQYIASLVKHQDLSREQAASAMELLMTGEALPTHVSAFLVALAMKGETVDEITGLAEIMRKMATPIHTNRQPLVDTCGTGGDHSNTFNISTAAAFVVAGAGVAVAKHGNRSASSQCGSADVLESLGINIEAGPDRVGACIDEAGIGFLFARLLHTAMKHVAPVRSELKIRTVFNILGPLTNPARACGQVMGVFDSALVEPLAHVLANLGARRAFVVAGSDGLDELTLGGPSFVAEAVNGTVKTYEIDPAGLGLPHASREAIAGGDAEASATILRGVLEGKPGPYRDVVVLNAAAGILAGQAGGEWREAVQAAQKSIDSGAALEKLEQLSRISHDS
ncbi:MAG: anthranilate phosphoribosyltransferase [Candidatus Hydrogenedentota bacterium]